MRSKITKKHLEQIAKENNIRVDQLQKVIDSFFRFTIAKMSEGDRDTMKFSNVRLMKWGTFKAKEGRKSHFKNINKNEKSNRDN